MECAAARDWLLLADEVRKPSAEVAAHLAGCAECQRLAIDLAGIESAVRSVPTPAVAVAGRDAFLARLAPVPRRSWRDWRIVGVVGVLAASLVLGVGLAALIRPQPQENPPGPESIAQARPAVVEDLVEWNLRLTEVEAPAERQKLVRDRLPQLQAAVQSASLSTEDRAFADQLLAHAQRMEASSDAVDEAETFHTLADTLLLRLDTIADDPDRSEFYARLYSQVRDRGLDANLARAERQAQKAEKLARVQNLKKAKNKLEVKAAAVAERMNGKAREHIKPNRPKGKAAKAPQY